MTRIRVFVTIVLPSMISGGILFNLATGNAASSERTAWTAPMPIRLAQASPPKLPRPRAPVAPAPPVPPARHRAPPIPPAPTMPPIRDILAGQLDAARASVVNNQQLSTATRDMILARLDKVRATIDKRLANITFTDMEKFGDEMEKLGDEIEGAMAGVDDQIESAIQNSIRQTKHRKFSDSHDDDDDMPEAPGLDDDDSDLREAISELKDLALTPAQRAQITKLRTDSDGKVASANKQIADLSTKLQSALGDPKTSDVELSRMVDQISAQEAALRKARILAWVQARRVLDVAQRRKIEDAAKKAKTK